MVKTFTRDEMFDVLDGNKGKVLVDRIIDTGRWSTLHRLVFQLDGQCYETQYQRAATEQQECDEWYDDKTIDCAVVVPYEHTVIDYRLDCGNDDTVPAILARLLWGADET